MIWFSIGIWVQQENIFFVRIGSYYYVFRDIEVYFMWCQVSYYNGVMINQCLWIWVSRMNIGEDIVFFIVEIQCQVQQFVRIFNKFCVFNQCNVQVNFSEVVKGDGFLNWIICQWVSYWCGSGFYFFFRGFYQCFNLFYIDVVIQCFEWIYFVVQQWLLDIISGQFCIEECFCMFGQFWQYWFQVSYQYVEQVDVY